MNHRTIETWSTVKENNKVSYPYLFGSNINNTFDICSIFLIFNWILRFRSYLEHYKVIWFMNVIKSYAYSRCLTGNCIEFSAYNIKDPAYDVLDTLNTQYYVATTMVAYIYVYNILLPWILTNHQVDFWLRCEEKGSYYVAQQTDINRYTSQLLRKKEEPQHHY